MGLPDFMKWQCSGCGATAEGNEKPCDCITTVGHRKGPNGSLEHTVFAEGCRCYIDKSGCPAHTDPHELTAEWLIAAFDLAIRDPKPIDQTRYEYVGEELLSRLTR